VCTIGEKLLHNVADDEPWPQSWMDDYINATSRLLLAFAPSSLLRAARQSAPQSTPRSQGVAPSLCVVWRAQNIAARHTNRSETRHHPSSVNGVHHWLNRFSIGLARQFGYAIIDLTELTTRQRPAAHNVDARSSRAPKRAEALEGDVYHGYSSAELAPHLLLALSEACCPG
jgi:hypothetical protein